jgi:hypothetical protein
LSIILSKDPRRKLPQGSCPLIRSKDQRKKLTRQSRAYNTRKIEEEESAEEETLKILVIFKNHQRIHEEELQKAETLKISQNSLKSVKDCCRRKHRLKIFGNRSNLSKIKAENKELVKFFQIFERFTNFSSAGENSCKGSKERVSGSKNNRRGRKICPTSRSEAEIQFRRDEESTEKAKEFQPLDLAQRPDSRWINEKVHKV